MVYEVILHSKKTIFVLYYFTCIFSNLQIEFFISDLNDGQTNVEKEPNENFNTSAIPENDEPLQELAKKSSKETPKSSEETQKISEETQKSSEGAQKSSKEAQKSSEVTQKPFEEISGPENDEPLRELATKSLTKKIIEIENKSKDNSKDSFLPSYLNKTTLSTKYGVKERVPNVSSRRDSTQRLFNILLSSSSKKRKNEDSDINFSSPNKKVNTSRATNASNSTDSEMSDFTGFTDTPNDAEKSDEFIEFLAKNISQNEEKVVVDDSNIMSKVTPKKTQKSSEETQKSSEETQKSSEETPKPSEETPKLSEETQKSSEEISGPYEVTGDPIEAAMLKIHDDKYYICLTPNNEKTKLDTNESCIDEVQTQSGSECDKTVNQEPEKMTENNDISTSKEMAEKDQQSIEDVTIEEATSFFEPLLQEQNDLIPNQTYKQDKKSSNSPKSTDNMKTKSNSDPLVDSQKETTYSAQSPESPNRNTNKRFDKKKEANSKPSLNLKIRLTSPIKILPKEVSENSIEITPTEKKAKKKRSHIKTPENLHKKAKLPAGVMKKAEQVDIPENELIVEPIHESDNTNINTENLSKLDKNQTKGAKLSNSKKETMVEPIDEFGETNSNAEDPKDLITPENTTSNEDLDTFTKLLQKESNRSRLSISEKLDVIGRFEKGEKKTHIAKDLGMNESSIRNIIKRKEKLIKFKKIDNDSAALKKTDGQTSSSKESKNSDASANQKSMSNEVHIEKEDTNTTKDIIPYLDRNDLKMGCLFDVLVVPITDYQKIGPGKKASSKVQERKKGEKTIFL